LQRQIIRIADKFCDSEFQYLNTDSDEYIRILTVIWGAKEAILKLETKRISFKDHISVEEFHKQ
jgi:phosphopantetheinyl transferase (holo-ACP synthase)